MFFIFRFLFLITLLFLFLSCGANNKNKIIYKAYDSFQVSKNSKVAINSKDTKISISINTNTKATNIQVLSGSVTYTKLDK